jgi:DNA-binding HxlR family transcriptional regulator
MSSCILFTFRKSNTGSTPFIKLARRLKELEKDGILERHAYNEIPAKVEYKLTRKGQD